MIQSISNATPARATMISPKCCDMVFILTILSAFLRYFIFFQSAFCSAVPYCKQQKKRTHITCKVSEYALINVFDSASASSTVCLSVGSVPVLLAPIPSVLHRILLIRLTQNHRSLHTVSRRFPRVSNINFQEFFLFMIYGLSAFLF